MSPTISIIVLVYNHAHLLTRNLAAFAKQTTKDFELVFVDNASTDNSYELLEAFQAANPDMSIVLYKNDVSTVCEGRKKGFLLSKGKYVAFHDGDDWLDGCFIEKNIETIREHHDPDAVFCLTASARSDNEYIYTQTFPKNVIAWSKPSLQGYLIKRKIIEDHINCFQNTYFEDFFYTSCINSAIKSIVLINEPLYFYYVNPQGATGSSIKKAPLFLAERFADLCRCVTDYIMPTIDQENEQHLMYALVCHYFSIIYQGNATRKYTDIRRAYIKIYDAFNKAFPKYRACKYITLFKANYITDSFRKRIWLSVFLERIDSLFHNHIMMSALLLCYKAAVSLRVYQVHH